MEDRASLDCLLDQLEKKSGRRLREDGRRKTEEGSDVHLNVYDMVWLNGYTSPLGIGAFHSGVEVYDREYAYGGHPYSYTGVYNMEPRQEDEIAGQGVRFRESLFMGHIHLTQGEVRELVHTLGKEYNGNTYHILNKNCNHFTSDLCQKLCGAQPPPWINRLAYVSSWMPFVLNCIPPSWITPEETNSVYSSCSAAGSLSRAQHLESDSDDNT